MKAKRQSKAERQTSWLFPSEKAGSDLFFMVKAACCPPPSN
jgi:hypothetical protein